MAYDKRNFLKVVSAAATGSLLSGRSSAQVTSSVDALLTANRVFDEALSRLDIAALSAMSLREPHVFAIHPGAREITFGHEAVGKSWQSVADRFSELSVVLRDPRAVMRDGVGWVTGTETVTGKRKTGEAVSYSALTTNIFELRDGRWLLSAHLTSRITP